MLAAKVQPPRQAAATLLRTRLINALYRHVENKLQLVVAPAGFGKTTLLVDFVRDADFPVCWATLDGTDRDLAAFIETVAEAVRRVFPAFGERVLAAIQDAREIERRTGALARVFANEAAANVDAFAVLVLDDYHEVNESPPVTQFVDELLRQLPDNLRIVLASRTLPALTVSRLIVEQQLFGLGEADLRFTAHELLTLLRRRQGLSVTPEQALALAEGAEGWVAGFLLTVPRLWEGLVGGLISARGGEGPLYDYLAAEAFDGQPPDVQRFLLATAIPETVDPALCAALLGPGNWQAMLDRVEYAGLFVVRLQTAQGDFRYHQLFRTFLQTRLRRADPAEFARLHAAVAAEMARRDDWPAALNHYLAAELPDAAAALVERIGPGLERSGRWRALADAVAGLPIEAAAAHPHVPLAGARAALILGDLARAERFAVAAHEAGARAGDTLVEARGLAALGSVRRLQGRTRDALEILGRALELAPDDGELAAAVRRDTGQCLGVQGDFAGAIRELSAAVAYFDHAAQASEAARAEFGLGVAMAKSGRLTEAIARYEASLDRWRKLGDAGMEAEMLNCLGCAYGYRGDYARARDVLQEGLARARDEGYQFTEGATLHSLGDVLLSAGDVAGARETFERGLAIMQEIGELWVVTHLFDALALTSAFEGNLTRAEEHAHHAIDLAKRQESRYLEALCSLTLGAVQSRAGKPEALTTLLRAADALAEIGAPRETARAHLWLMQAQFAAGALASAQRHLESALEVCTALGGDAVLDLHARWDPAPFAAAQAAGVASASLETVLSRTRLPLPEQEPDTAPVLPALSARAFGPGALSVDEAGTVDWVWEKARELFFLLLHGGPRRQEQITAVLWPESSSVRAKAALHTAVYRLRKATHPQAIVLRSGVYRVDEEFVTFYDVRAFERLLQEAAATSGDQAIAALQAAVKLYAAPFLEPLDAEWCSAERDRLARLYLLALERLADAHAAAGEFAESVAAASALLAQDPLREDVHARLIRAYLRLGDRAAALAQYERCEALLREELGVQPGPELRGLFSRIRA